jgi:hypothetical protein
VVRIDDDDNSTGGGGGGGGGGAGGGGGDRTDTATVAGAAGAGAAGAPGAAAEAGAGASPLQKRKKKKQKTAGASTNSASGVSGVSGGSNRSHVSLNGKDPAVSFEAIGPGKRKIEGGRTVVSYEKLHLRWGDGRAATVGFGSGVVIPNVTDDGDDITFKSIALVCDICRVERKAGLHTFVECSRPFARKRLVSTLEPIKEVKNLFQAVAFKMQRVPLQQGGAHEEEAQGGRGGGGGRRG